MKYLLFVIIILFCSCSVKEQETQKTSNSEIQVDFLFEKNGCKVYRFSDGGCYIYFTDCSGKTEYTQTTTVGKTIITEKIQNITK